MIAIDVCGLPVGEALDMLAAQGIYAKVEYTKPPFPKLDTEARSPRVVTLRGAVLITALFRDGIPEDTDEKCR